MTMHKALLSSESVEWETPKAFFDEINGYFNFVLDLAAKPHNAKCTHFIEDIFNDGLYFKMSVYESLIADRYAFLNPPYGREIGKFIKRAIEFTKHFNMGLVMLLPARVDTKWFHDYILNDPFIFYRSIDEMFNHYAPRGITKIALIKGRINFVDSNRKDKAHGSTFPSVLVVKGL